VKGQPTTKVNLSGDFERQWFGATLRGTRYGKVLAAGSEPFLDVPLKAKWVTDLELRAKPFGDRFTFALGGNNLFDVYPTNIPRGHGVDPVTGLPRNYPATNYVAPFSNFSPFGFNGRFLYGRVDVNF
jgi:iron complex outermembrane receptor protein